MFVCAMMLVTKNATFYYRDAFCLAWCAGTLTVFFPTLASQTLEAYGELASKFVLPEGCLGPAYGTDQVSFIVDVIVALA